MSPKLRSKVLTPDLPQYHVRRVFLKAGGATDADLEKPLIAIANTWNEILPGSYRLDRIAAAVKRGIRETGGMATIFNVLATMSVADPAIIPLQDIPGLGEGARMNRPGTGNNHWKWQLLPGKLIPEMAEQLRAMTETFDRVG